MVEAVGKEAGSGRRLLIDLGPLLAFFIANKFGGIFVATGVFMAAIAVALAAAWKLEHRVPRMTVVTGIAVLVFGGLTLWLQDEVFIQIKLTVVNLLIAGVLFGGLLAGRSFLKSLLGHAFQLSDEGWRKLTLRYAVFFSFLAVLNEVLRRLLSLDDWVTFKVFGTLAATFVFTIAQVPLLQRHELVAEEPVEKEPS